MLLKIGGSPTIKAYTYVEYASSVSGMRSMESSTRKCSTISYIHSKEITLV